MMSMIDWMTPSISLPLIVHWAATESNACVSPPPSPSGVSVPLAFAPFPGPECDR